MWKKIAIFFWGLVICIVFFSSLETQLIINNTFKRQVNILFPQGWGFFTKSPREYKLEVYKLRNDNSLDKLTVKNQSFENFYGFSRKSRYIGYESSIIASKIPLKEWKENSYEKIRQFTNTCVRIKYNEEHNYIKKGVYIFKLQKQIPFIWANLEQEKFNPAKFTKVCIY